MKSPQKLPWPGRQLLLPLLMLGVTGVFAYNVLFLKGLKLVEAGRASVIIASNPILIALFASLIYKEKLGLPKIIGILLSVTGAIIVITRGEIFGLLSQGLGLGELYIFGCVGSWVAFSLLGKDVMQKVPPLTSVTYGAVAGTLLLAVPAFLEEGFRVGHYRFVDWISIFYLGFFGTAISFLWYYQGIEQIGPSRAGLYINLVPISAVLMAYVFLGEAISMLLLVGTALVSSGIYLTNKE